MEFYYFAWWVGDNESPVGVKLGLVPCALSQEHFLSTVTLGLSGSMTTASGRCPMRQFSGIPTLGCRRLSWDTHGCTWQHPGFVPSWVTCLLPDTHLLPTAHTIALLIYPLIQTSECNSGWISIHYCFPSCLAVLRFRVNGTIFSQPCDF